MSEPLNTKLNSGAAIKKLRADLGLTQKDFREKVGIGLRRMSQIETGQTALSEKDQAKIIQIFDLPADYFDAVLDAEILPDSAKRVIQIRHLFGLTQIEFAQKIGITQPNLSSIESGRRTVGKYVLRSIIEAFKINPAWWETGEGRMVN